MIALILCIVAALVINSVLASMVIIRFKSRMFSSELNALRKARHDPLTDLSNRLGLSEEFEKKTRSSTTMKDRMVLVYADLDNFKNINDTYGHKDGDQVLCTIASRIKNDIHHQDIAVRMGGDKFVILLSGKEAGKDALSPGQIKQFIKRMTANICKPICINESTHQVGVSCGVAIYPNDGEDLQSLLDAADNSMYRSKKSKKKLDQANDSNINPVGLVTS
jgi:diguanylate cyclase (GGDEF)-like protein